MPEDLLDPIHPGEILLEEFMKPLGLTINALARALDTTPTRIHGLVHGRRAITADTALRLGRYFRVAPETWLRLQSDYDLQVAEREAGERIRERVEERVAS